MRNSSYDHQKRTSRHPEEEETLLVVVQIVHNAHQDQTTFRLDTTLESAREGAEVEELVFVEGYQPQIEFTTLAIQNQVIKKALGSGRVCYWRLLIKKGISKAPCT
jgi:hypothetical protein